MNNPTSTQMFLYSALDWGLGHTTRSISILNKIKENNTKIYIACEPESPSEKILKQAFPNAVFLPLKGYGISYIKHSNLFAWKILMQIPKIIAAIKNEKKMVSIWCKKYKIDLIISDNRYGFFNEKIKSVFITHQLQIAAPFLFLERIIQRLNYRYINCFSECWVPDFEGENNLAGKLSHPEKMPAVPVKYIGAKSRLIKKESEKKYDFLILLSGPEPQRTILENKFLQIKNQFKEKVLLVRGLPNEQGELTSTNNFIIKNYCDTDELSELIAASEFVIARSGYSTVMDLYCLKKKAIFIPTPGQTEQEYLAVSLMNKGFAYYFKQNEKDYYKKILQGKEFDFKIWNDTI
ncbi:MAG: glycosyltransferase [Arachidicoccus sp.]|nr:glycosyltransferase [Arachidicoccus sp.]